MKRYLSLALVLLFSCAQVLTAQQDRIIRKKGDPIIGVKVVSEDYRAVKYETPGGGSARTIKASQVLDVFRKDAPAAFTDGRSACRSGDYRNAISLLRLAVRNTKAGAWLQEYGNYWLGEAQRLGGKPRDAIASYRKVMAAKADSRLMPAARLGIIRALLSSKDYKGAQGEAASFRREVTTRRLDQALGIEAQLLEAECFRGEKRWMEAAGAYRRVESAGRSGAAKTKDEGEKDALLNLALEAAWNRGYCLVEAKDYAQASAAFDVLERQGETHPRARAIGSLGKGLVELRRGNLDLARMALTKTIAVEVAAEKEIPRAYLYLGETYIALSAKGEKSAKKYARGYLDDLVRLFSGTPEAIAARDLLQHL